MSFWGKIITLFPGIHTLFVIASVCFFIVQPHIFSFLLVPFSIYLFPLLAFHLHQIVARLQEGTFDITKGYSAWYGTHMIQLFFITFTSFEGALRLVPGLFSFWLRLWGSSVGKGVYWAPHFEVADRSLLVIGNRAVFGYGVKINGHMINPSRTMGRPH